VANGGGQDAGSSSGGRASAQGVPGVTALALAWPAGGGAPTLSPLGFVATDDPCHVALHPSGAWVFSASYSAGTLSISAVDAAGGLSPATSYAAAANAHQVVFSASGVIVYITCLGDDSVLQFTFDAASGALRPLAVAPRVALPAGSGPRHLAIAPDGRRAYVLCELASALVQFGFDVDGSLIAPSAPISTLRSGRPPPALQAAAAVVVSADGRFIYVSNRASPLGAGDNSVLVLAAGADEETPPTPLAWVDEGVNFPRDITLSTAPGQPALIIANQNDATLALYRRDAATGNLSFVSSASSAPVTGTSFVLTVM
jgi:6-phosphogluconolactonase (cycloisomerase 2 family)